MVRTTTVIEAPDAVVSPPPSRASCDCEAEVHMGAGFYHHPWCATKQAAALRDRIRRAVCEAEGFTWDTDMLEPDEYGEVADAVLSVLPVQDDRAAVLLWAADHLLTLKTPPNYTGVHGLMFSNGVQAAGEELRRLAVEARPAGTQQPAAEAEAEAQLELKDYEYGCPNCSQPIIVGHRAQHVCTGAQQQPAAEAPADPTNWPCNAAVTHRLGDLPTAHGPHLWVVQPDMEPVRCPGTYRVDQITEQQPAAEAPFVPPAHYRGRDGTAYCVHAAPIGPDSCRACRDLADN